MMNWVSRCSERTSDVLPSTASESPGKNRQESQSLLSPQTEQHYRTERPVVYAHSSSYSEWNVDKTWSSQEWKSDELMEDRTGRPVLFAQHTDRFIVENDKMNSYTEAESELSLESRSFFHRRVNDQVRKRQTNLKSCSRRQRQTFCDMGNVYVFYITSICINGKELLRQLAFYQKYRRSHNVFGISEKLITEQSDEIYGVKTINWEHSSWKYLSSVGDEQVISLQRTKVYVFSDSVLCLGKMKENPQSNYALEDRLTWFKSSSEYRTLDRIDGEPMEFEWNIFPGFNTLQLSQEVKELQSRLSVTPEKFTARIIFMSMFNDISWRSEDNKKECESNAQLVSLLCKEIWSRTMVIPRTWFREKVVFYQ